MNLPTATHRACSPPEGAPLPEISKPRPLVTYRVLISGTAAALRRGFVERPNFDLPRLYGSEMAEFPSREVGELALIHVNTRTDMRGKFLPGQLQVLPVVHEGLTTAEENALLCRVRDTMCELAISEMVDQLTPTRKGLVGFKGGWR